MSGLPPGFVIDGAALPPGFVVDGESAPVTTSGLGAAAVSGLGKGVTQLAGLPGDLGDLLNRSIDKGMNAIGIQPMPLAPNTFGSQNIQKQVEKITGEFHKPQNTAEKYVDTAASFVPGAMAAPGGMASNAIRYGVLPGLASEAAGQATAGQASEPYARAAAGIGAGLINPARAITPFPASPARQAAVNTLANEGVTSLTAGQRTGNLGLRYLEDAASSAPMAGGGAHRIQDEGQRQFTEAALRRAGTGPDATPEILAENQRRLSHGYRDISARNTVTPDNQMVNDIVDSVQRYHFVPGSQQHAMVQGYIDDIISHINNGSMSGQHYQALRSFLTADAKSASDGHLQNALTGIRNALDNAMTRSVSTEDAAAWRNLNREYSAQEVIKKAASRAGEATSEGQITPANLRNTIAGEDRSGYSLGRGQFNELARAGIGAMTPLPNSGTAQRTNAFHILNNFLLGLPQAAAGRVLMNPVVQELLANQLMRGTLPTSRNAQQLLIAQQLQRGSQNGP